LFSPIKNLEHVDIKFKVEIDSDMIISIFF